MAGLVSVLMGIRVELLRAAMSAKMNLNPGFDGRDIMFKLVGKETQFA
jgi:hypothetical protein